MIQVQNLCKSFGEKTVLRDISVDFHRGKNNMIIGMSGSGKTVLMKCLVGLLTPEKGAICFDGRDIIAFNRKEQGLLRQEIGMVFQGGALFDSLTVEENVLFPLDMYTDQSREEKRDRANTCLQRVNLENANRLYPSELSGGMKKRVAIARAISMQPQYLFCDEPNSGLDPQTSGVIDALISEITEEYGITTLINTHDMNSVLQIGDQVSFIYQGQLWWQGNKDNICCSDNRQLIAFLEASELTRRILKS